MLWMGQVSHLFTHSCFDWDSKSVIHLFMLWSGQVCHLFTYSCFGWDKYVIYSSHFLKNLSMLSLKHNGSFFLNVSQNMKVKIKQFSAVFINLF